MMNIPKFFGYRRENGRVGVRNHVVILPLDDLSNAASEAVAGNIKGTMAIPHSYGRLQFGEDLELFFRTIIGTGANPNVAAVVVIGIEPEWTDRIVRGVAETGKPVKGFYIERNGDLNTIAAASRQAKEYVQWASELPRTECSMDELYVSVNAKSDTVRSGVKPDREQCDRQAGGHGSDNVFWRNIGNNRCRVGMQRTRCQSRNRRGVHESMERLQ
jgi:(2R)-sulfolactate sulfo-lyase subunit beta